MSVPIYSPPVGMKQSERSVTIPSYFSLAPVQRRMVDNKQWQNLASIFKVSDQAVRNYYTQPVSASVKEEEPVITAVIRHQAEKRFGARAGSWESSPADPAFRIMFRKHMELRKLTIKAWCMEVGLKFSTVKHAIARSGHLSSDTRKKITDIIESYAVS